VTIHEIPTPALLVDLDGMEANLERMAAFFRTAPAKLRPHYKNHKCPELAQRQLDAGAIGLTCATLSEAECLVEQGVRQILLANEIVDPIKMLRSVELARQADIIFCVDDERVADDFARAGRNGQTPISVLVDVDIGQHRCGVPPGDPTVLLVRKVLATGLRFRGLMGYGGHLSHQLPGPEKADAVAAALRPLMETIARLEGEGFAVEIVSGGATGTYSLTGRDPGLTEVQAGSYLLMDTNYRECCTDFDLTLTVLSTVISKTGREYVIVDAGVKTLSSERGIPLVKGPGGLTLRKLNAEHGIIELGDDAPPISIGDRIEIWVRYSDATVNLHDRMYGVRNGTVEKIFQLCG
jgi:D-serine deaminase-like pyridoxal phosphate-dependent protein